MAILYVDPEYRHEGRRALQKERRKEEILGGLSALGGLVGLGLKRQSNLDQQAFMSRMLPIYSEAASSGDPEKIRRGIRMLGDQGGMFKPQGLFSPLGRLVGLGERSEGIPADLAMKGMTGLQGLLPKPEEAGEMALKTFNAETARMSAETQRQYAETQRAKLEREIAGASGSDKILKQAHLALQTDAGKRAFVQNPASQIVLNLADNELTPEQFKVAVTEIEAGQKSAREYIRGEMEKEISKQMRMAKTPEEVFAISDRERDSLHAQELGVLSDDLEKITNRYEKRLRDKSGDQMKFSELYDSRAKDAESRQNPIAQRILRIENMLLGRRPTALEVDMMDDRRIQGKMTQEEFEAWLKNPEILSEEQKGKLVAERQVALNERAKFRQRAWENRYASAHTDLPKNPAIGRGVAIAEQMIESMASVEDESDAGIAAWDAFKTLATEKTDPELLRLVEDLELQALARKDPDAVSAQSDIAAALRNYLEDRDPYYYETSR